MRQFCVTENEAGQRFDKFLTKYMDLAPKSFFYKMLRKKNITLNGKKAEGKEKLAKGDVIKMFLSEETIEGFRSGQKKAVHTEEKLAVLYENHHVMLLNKPCGILSQKACKEDISMVEHVISHLLATGEVTEEMLKTFRPSVCNRLDRNTSGILAAGKTLPGLQMLSEMFKERTVHKFYLCIVKGVIKEPEELSGWLLKDERTNQVRVFRKERDGAKQIHTRYHPIGDNGKETLLEVELLTGRTHQIRAHLASTGHPLLGDGKYGDVGWNEAFRKEYGLKGQLLHAYRLEMPVLGGEFSDMSERCFYAPAPELFLTIAEKRGLGTWRHGIPEV